MQRTASLRVAVGFTHSSRQPSVKGSGSIAVIPDLPGSPLTVEQLTALRKCIAELGLTNVTVS